MTEKTKFFKTIVRFEVLSAEAPFEGSLARLVEEVTNGSMSGRFLESEITEVTRDEARAGLVAQGSDADFLDQLFGDEDDEEQPATATSA